MADTEELLDIIEAVRFNPSGIQRVILQRLEDKLEGSVDIVDATNPFVFLLEASTITSCAAMMQSETNTRKQYSSLSQTEDELYLHMSDEDYLGRFASPARTQFTILLGKDELYSKAVPTGIGSVRKLVIPRHTEFTIADYKFTMQYPIEIRIMSHGGLQVVYNAERTSPLQTLESNLVTWSIVNVSSTEFIKLDIPISQFELRPFYDQLNDSTGFNKNFPYEQQYYYCRVYVSTTQGGWDEIRTTHTEQVYDPRRPTAVLKVKQGELNVQIPQIYFTTALLGKDIRVDIYTTRGSLDLILGSYTVNNFTAKWRDLDGDDNGTFSAPLLSYSTMAVYSDQTVSGGAPGLSFEELRSRVMNNALGNNNLPITGAQLESVMSNLGYQVVKDVDNITNRIYLATRALPAPRNRSTSSGAGCTITTLQTSFEALRVLESVADNDERLTILPDTLYERVGGVTKIVPQQRIDELNNLTLEVLSYEINNHDYMYTPFHYVLDAGNEGFESRCYYLDRPEIESKVFVQENDTAELEVTTGAYSFTRIADGYRLVVKTASGDSFKALTDDQIHVQLSFKPQGEVVQAYINGIMTNKVDDERIYEFIIRTNYDVNAEHRLFLTNFKMYDDLDRKLGAMLLEDFEIIYAVANYTSENMEYSAIDQKLGKFMLPAVPLVGIMHERFKLRLGYSLEGLWANTRSVVSSENYAKHIADEPWFYEETIYQRDPVTGAIELSLNEDTQEIEYTILHAAGDPVLDEEGEQVYKHRIGDIRYDLEGNPVIAQTRGMLRQVDLLVIDGKYKYATEVRAVEYRESLAMTIVDWVTENIATISKSLLEQTKIYFYPKTTFGDVSVYIEGGITSVISSEQSFRVKYFMSREAYNSVELRAPLTQTAIDVINESLMRTTISVPEIASRIKASVGDDVMGVEVSGLGDEADISTMTLKDSSDSCTIRKRLQVTPDGRLTIEDDVSIDFIRHINEA